MLSAFQVSEINAILLPYYKLYLTTASAGFLLIKNHLKPYQAQRLLDHVDKGNKPPFGKTDLETIIANDIT